MSRRVEPPDSLDLFCSPPWSTRALIKHVLGKRIDWSLQHAVVWDPCCGLGHMSEVLADYAQAVRATDVFDYGYGAAEVGSFVGDGNMVGDLISMSEPDWLIFNPPFNLALPFVLKGLGVAKRGVAALVRTAWLEGEERYNELFSERPPTVIAQFVERVPMVKGRWDPAAASATAYCWLVWDVRRLGASTFEWIPPGRRVALTHVDDIKRFAARSAGLPVEGPAGGETAADGVSPPAEDAGVARSGDGVPAGKFL